MGKSRVIPPEMRETAVQFIDDGVRHQHVVEKDPGSPFRGVTPNLRVMGGRGLQVPPCAEGFKLN